MRARAGGFLRSRGRSMSALLALTVLAAAAPADAPPPAPVAAQDGYNVQLAQLKGGDVGIDFKSLRAAYAQSADYHPYGGDAGPRRAMIAAFKAGQCNEALAAADKVLDADYLDLDAHYISFSCQSKAGRADKAAFHKAVFLGLLNAILSSGDGKSQGTAYAVLSAPEEYTVVGYLGLRPSGQSLIHADGHSYDRLDVTDTKSGAASGLYFNVDVPLGWLNRRLSQGAAR